MEHILDVCTVHFADFFFFYICPTDAQYTLTMYVSDSTAACFDVYTSSSGSLLLCTLNTTGCPLSKMYAKVTKLIFLSIL